MDVLNSEPVPLSYTIFTENLTFVTPEDFNKKSVDKLYLNVVELQLSELQLSEHFISISVNRTP